MAPSTFLTQIQHVLLQKNPVLQENNTNCLVQTIGASKISKLKQSQESLQLYMSRDSLVWIYNLVKKIGFSAEKIVELSGCVKGN